MNRRVVAGLVTFMVIFAIALVVFHHQYTVVVKERTHTVVKHVVVHAGAPPGSGGGGTGTGQPTPPPSVTVPPTTVTVPPVKVPPVCVTVLGIKTCT